MVYFGIAGRLGNWMFQYANAMSYARRIGADVRGYIVEKWSSNFITQYKELFKTLEIVEKIPASVCEYQELRFGYDCILEQRDKDLLLKGYFQSEKYFDKPLVRELFKISKRRESYLRGKYGTWLDRPNVTGISVRRGDYLVNLENFPFVGKRYLKECIERIPECDDFIVCSDDIPWCKRFFLKNFPAKRFLFIEKESAFDQLYVHTLCKNNIVSNSSFSWWGAWLNGNPNKRVLAPSMWFGYKSTRMHIDWSDIYFDGMEIVKNRYSLGMYIYAHLYDWQKQIKKMIREAQSQ